MMTSDLARRCAAVRAKLWGQVGRGRGVCVALAMLFGVFSGPVAAQSQTTVRITSASPATFSAAGQLITFNVQLYTGNTPINGLSFTSGSPSSITNPLSCPGLPAGTQTTVICTFAYTTQAGDVASNRVLGYGRWTATRPNGANRSSDTNQLIVPYASAAPSTIGINDVTASEGNAGTTNYTFTVGLSAPAGPGGVGFDIATANNTATAGTDYVAKSLASQTIPAGSSSYSFTVQVNGDTLNEPNEDFFVNLTNVTGATVADGQGRGTISNDDPLPSLSIVGRNITERNAMTQAELLQVTLSTASGQAVSVNYATANGTAMAGSDYVATSGTLVIPAGTTTGNISVGVTGDTTNEPDETFTVTLSSPVNATIATGTGTYTILNDDALPPTVTSISPTGGPTSGGTTVVITGTNFSGATGISFGGTAALGYTINGNTQITATAPAGSGTVDVRVTTAGGTSATSAADQYTYIAAPTVTSISPASGPTSGGTTVVVTGTNFSGATAVGFGGAAATGYTINSSTQITATAPAGSGTVDVRVTTAGGTSATSAADQYTYVALPAANNVGATVAYGSSGNPITLNITGGAATSVAVATAPAHGAANVSGTSITYTPTTGYAGPDSFTYTATNASGTSAPATVTITVAAPTLTVSPTTLPTAQVGTAYSQTIVASGGTAAYTYAVTAGSLPAGLALSGSSGVLSGTPTMAGTFNLTVTATDASGFTGSRAYTLIVGAPTLTMTPAPGTLSMPYGQATTINFAASRGTATYSFSLVAGSLPVGVSMSSAGVLSGTPTVPGIYNVTVRAVDSSTGAGAPFSVDQSYMIVVAIPSIVIDPAALPNGAVGASYGQTLSASGGVAPYSFSLLAGALPIGMSFSSAGVLSGVPRSDGNFSLTLRATDANGQNASRVYTFSIAAPTLAVSPATLPGGSNGVAYSQTLSTSGGVAPYGYSIVSGALPIGLSFSSAGVLSGTPAVAGSYTFNIRSTDDAGYNTTIAYTLAIGGASQTIAFAAQAAQTFVANGTFALNPLATASSGLAVSYSSQSAGVCSISGTAVTMLAAGDCVIAADQAGDANYLAAPQVTQAIAIGKAAQAITSFIANPAAPVYASGGMFAVSATGGASANPVVFASSTPGVCTVSGGTVAILAAGACSLTANQAGDTNYNAAPQVTLSVTIGAATPTLGWIGGLHKTVGEAAFELPNPTSNSGGAFTFTSSNPAVATISGRAVTIVGAGQATLVATQAAAGNYAAGTVSLVLTVDDRPDPTKDAEVVGGLQAQLDAAVRFATAQQANIHDRLRQLRSTGGNASSNNLSVSLTGDNGPGLSLNADQVAGASTLPKGWGVWTAGVVTLGDRDARSASEGFDWRSDGVTVGVDRAFGDQVVLGVAAGIGWNTTDFDRSVSELDAKQRSVSLYGLWRSGKHAFADAMLGMGRLEFDIDRWSEVAGKTATARREGGQTFGSLTFGYEQRGERGTLTGYGRYDAVRMRLDAYRENGLGIYDLRYASQDVENDTMALGLENRYAFKRATSLWRPYWKLEYRQALQNQGDAAINYVIAPRSSDYLLGLRSYNDDVLSLGGGLDIDFSSGWALSFLFLREQARETTANSFGLRVSYGSTSGISGARYVPPAPGSLDRPATGP